MDDSSRRPQAGPGGASSVILVNGVPGAGKTTLARALSRRLRLPLFSKDVIKEAHADVFGAAPPAGCSPSDWDRQFGAAANQTMWALLADAPAGAILESTWPAAQTWPYVASGLARAGAGHPVQIWCQIPVAVARARFDQRQPSRHLLLIPPDDADWEQRWARAEPLPIPDTLRVQTTEPVDVETIVTWLRTNAGLSI
jgi:glucokinase